MKNTPGDGSIEGNIEGAVFPSLTIFLSATLPCFFSIFYFLQTNRKGFNLLKPPHLKPSYKNSLFY